MYVNGGDGVYPLPDIVKKFSRYMRNTLNRSQKTVSEYEHDLLTFFRYIKAVRLGIPLNDDGIHDIDITDVDIDFIRDITFDDIDEYINYTASERSNSAATRSRKLSSLRSFYKYLTIIRKVPDLQNPVADYQTPKKDKTLPKYLTLEEAIRLLDAVKNDKDSKNRKRDYAILTLFLNCGMRLSELTGIDISDIDPDLRSLRVVGKGNKERIVYLNEACREALSEYLTVRSAIPGIKDKNALFISRESRRMSNQTVQWMVYKYLDLAGLGNRKFSTHKLRHTAATLMYQTGHVDVRVLKDILGHEQLNTTQIYTHVSDAGMEKAMEQNPLSKVNIKNND